MALVDWRLLTSSWLLARISENASALDQAHTFGEVLNLIRSEHLRSVILDMDHAVARKARSGSVRQKVEELAKAMKDEGLERFALVHRGYQDANWDALVAELRACGVLASGFETVADAKTWLGGDGATKRA
ncbi:MAG: hypothetical protein RIA71_10105 [Oceanicaulis sp.]